MRTTGLDVDGHEREMHGFEDITTERYEGGVRLGWTLGISMGFWVLQGVIGQSQLKLFDPRGLVYVPGQ